jgi:enoyl-[acyl-carrier protein] reductase II
MPPGDGYEVVPRVLRTEFVAEWEHRPAEAGQQAEGLRGRIMETILAGRPHELTPFGGQSAGLIGDVLPAGEIVRRMVVEAEEALDRAAAVRAS